jgi:hypothetical protein
VTGRRALAPERVVTWVMWFLLKPLPGSTLRFHKQSWYDSANLRRKNTMSWGQSAGITTTVGCTVATWRSRIFVFRERQ